MLPISSVWIGDRLSRMEQLCVRSYLRFGHPFRLYAYGSPEGVPAGVELVDAATVLPTSAIFRVDSGAVGDFANYFKYRALLETGGCWTEMDEVCLRPWTDLGMFISSEWQGDDANQVVAIDQAAICIEAGHPLMRSLVESCEERLAEHGDEPLPHGVFGVPHFAQAVAAHDLQDRVAPPDVFCPLPWWRAAELLRPGLVPGPGPYGLQLWNEAWRRADWDKDAAPEGSPYAQLLHEVET